MASENEGTSFEEYAEAQEEEEKVTISEEEETESSFSFDSLNLKPFEKTILTDFLAGKYAPKEIWKIRDEIPATKRTSEQKALVKFDNLAIMQLREKKIKENPELQLFVNKKSFDDTPYKFVPICQPLRENGDPREDIYCLSSKEKKVLVGSDFGYKLDQHPEVQFLLKYSERAMPPNQTIVYYKSFKNDIPTITSQKYIARFYGEFRKDPFALSSLHIDDHTRLERKGFSSKDVSDQVKKMREITKKNRDDIENKGIVKSYFENLASLDKKRLENDGTDTFRDAIAIHDAPHSVALFLKQMQIEKTRSPEEQNRQFSIHNITGFTFPYGQEYVKYYTQEKSPVHTGKFPLIITSVATPVEELLDKNGCPTMFRRWCTRIYKQDESKDFYASVNLDGITQLLGISRYQSKDRAGLDPAISLAFWAYGKHTKKLRDEIPEVKRMLDTVEKISDEYFKKRDEEEGREIRRVALKHSQLMKNPIFEPNFNSMLSDLQLPREDIEGTPIKYLMKKDSKTQQWNLNQYSPDMHVYQSVPNFELNEPDQKALMKENGIKIHPIVEKFGMHGCMMCPFRDPDYYLGLKDNFPDLYKKAKEWRDIGAYKEGERSYSYIFTPAKYEKVIIGKLPSMEKYLDESKQPIF